jgi:hypothetical protein
MKQITTPGVNGDKPLRSALFLDFDNIYLGLRRLDEKAADAFATTPETWLTWLESGPGATSALSRRFLIRNVYLNRVAHPVDGRDQRRCRPVRSRLLRLTRGPGRCRPGQHHRGGERRCESVTHRPTLDRSSGGHCEAAGRADPTTRSSVLARDTGNPCLG